MNKEFQGNLMHILGLRFVFILVLEKFLNSQVVYSQEVLDKISSIFLTKIETDKYDVSRKYFNRFCSPIILQRMRDFISKPPFPRSFRGDKLSNCISFSLSAAFHFFFLFSLTFACHLFCFSAFPLLIDFFCIFLSAL